MLTIHKCTFPTHSPVFHWGVSQQNSQSRKGSTISKVLSWSNIFLIDSTHSTLTARMFPFAEGQNGSKHFWNLKTRSNPWLNLSSAFGPCLWRRTHFYEHFLTRAWAGATEGRRAGARAGQGVCQPQLDPLLVHPLLVSDSTRQPVFIFRARISVVQAAG